MSLRAINLVFAVCLYPVLYRLVAIHNPNGSNHLFTLALVWFPVGFFYNFVYYTDPGSTLFVLLSYLLSKQKHYTFAGLSGLVSLTFRQTNIIWVCFTMAISIMDIVGFKDDQVSIKAVQQLIYTTLRGQWIIRLWMFLLTIVAFVSFLLWNNGIVLGDKSNHVAQLHFPQLFYFSSFLSFFAAPWILTKKNVMACLQLTMKRSVGFLVVAIIMLYLVQHYTYEHPFLLSDNRHYTFYIWKNIYRRHWSVRYLAIPLYIVSGWFNWTALRQHTGIITCIGYCIAIALTLVPSPLLEFRYFIIPFLLFAIQLKPNAWQTGLALIMYVIIHGVTLYLFLYRPFTWTHEAGVQRFMW